MGDEVRSRFTSPDSHFNSFQFAASRITRKSYGPRVPDRTMVAKFERRSALLVSELTGFVAKKR
jgi:hypothetical protein